MRPLAFFSIPAAKRFIHSCCASLSVAVASLTVITFSCAPALPTHAVISIAASQPTAKAVPNLNTPNLVNNLLHELVHHLVDHLASTANSLFIGSPERAASRSVAIETVYSGPWSVESTRLVAWSVPFPLRPV